MDFLAAIYFSMELHGDDFNILYLLFQSYDKFCVLNCLCFCQILYFEVISVWELCYCHICTNFISLDAFRPFCSMHPIFHLFLSHPISSLIFNSPSLSSTCINASCSVFPVIFCRTEWYASCAIHCLSSPLLEYLARVIINHMSPFPEHTRMHPLSFRMANLLVWTKRINYEYVWKNDGIVNYCSVVHLRRNDLQHFFFRYYKIKYKMIRR